MQLAISLGIGGPYRVVDITDILLNAIGVLIGYGLFKAFAWLYRRLTQRLNLKRRGLSAYLYEIAKQAWLGNLEDWQKPVFVFLATRTGSTQQAKVNTLGYYCLIMSISIYIGSHETNYSIAQNYRREKPG